MTQDVDHGNQESKNYDPIKRKQIEIAYSIHIFQAMEDFLTIGAHDLNDTYVYINNFLMWMQPPILQKH